MNKITCVLAAIPLVMSLASPSMAALADSGDGRVLNGATGTIEILINQYAGLAPGDPESDAITHSVPPSQQLSVFTRASGPMSSGYTTQGSDIAIVSQSKLEGAFGRTGGNIALSGEAAAPAVASITLTHFVPDSLVSAVSGSITPSSSGASSAAPLTGTASINETPPTPIPTGTNIYTTITPLNTPVQPVPIPPACFLFGSGLAFFGAVRQRLRAAGA